MSGVIVPMEAVAQVVKEIEVHTTFGPGDGGVDATATVGSGVSINTSTGDVEAVVSAEGRLGWQMYTSHFVVANSGGIGQAVDVVSAGLAAKAEGGFQLGTQRLNLYPGLYARWQHVDSLFEIRDLSETTRNWELSAAAGVSVRSVATTEKEDEPHTGGFLAVGAGTCLGQECTATLGGGITGVVDQEGLSLIPELKITF